MSVNQLLKDAGDVCQRLWGAGHTSSVQGEVSYICTNFDQGGRSQEFDHLLHTSHMVNEALDSEISTKLKETQPEKIVSKIEAVTNMLEKIVNTDDTARKEYMEVNREGLQKDLDQVRTDIERKKIEVDEQFNTRLNELQIKFAHNDTT